MTTGIASNKAPEQPLAGANSRHRVADDIVRALLAHGVDRAFSVPGESFLPLLDALLAQTRLDLVTCRHEGAAALAAIADAKLTGRPGIALVSRGPGLFNAALGLHVAEQEAIPLILFVGQVDTPTWSRGAVQQVDTAQTFAGVVKWSTRITHADQAAEQIARAFAVAMHGTPGPVVVELPEDVLEFACEPGRPRVHGHARAAPSGKAIQSVLTMMTAAARPILLVGGECRSDEFRSDLGKMSELMDIPVVVTNKSQDQFSNSHPLFAGQLGFFPSPPLKALLDQADLIIAVGTRLGDLSSLGFTSPRQIPDPQALVHVYPDAAMIGRHFETQLAVVSTADNFVKAMLTAACRRDSSDQWLNMVADARRAVHGWQNDLAPQNDLFGQTVAIIADNTKANAVVTTDSGNFAGWVHRIFCFEPTHRLLGSACGAMGSGIPSAIAAALRYPERQVIAFCGDGGFLMTGNELATAVSRQLNLTIIVSNNKSYGTIRSHQERAYPRRLSGTDLDNPDFAGLARSFGAKGFTITSLQDAKQIVPSAMAERGPTLIEVRCNVLQSLDLSVRAMTPPRTAPV